MKYITNNEIALHGIGDAFNIAKVLLDNGYVAMISKEENLFIVNYVWSPNNADRNDVCFQSREIVEEEIFNPKDKQLTNVVNY